MTARSLRSFRYTSWLTAVSQTCPRTFRTSSSTCPVSRTCPFFTTTSSVAIASISDTMWVDSSTILSLPISLMILENRMRSFGSSPAVGSSSISIFGSLMTACAIPILRFMPPEKVFTFLSATSDRFTNSRTSMILSLSFAFGMPFRTPIYSRKNGMQDGKIKR